MRPVNLLLTEEGVLKLGYYGLATQAECYSIRKMDCDRVRSFAPEVFEGEYDTKSDVWSFGIVLVELMGIAPYYEYENNDLPTMNGDFRLPLKVYAIKSVELAGFLDTCFVERVSERWSVDDLMDVSVL